MEFKESVTEAGSYRITKDVNGNIYSIAVANEEATDEMKEFMRGAMDRRIAADARERMCKLDTLPFPDSPLYASIDGSAIVSENSIELNYYA